MITDIKGRPIAPDQADPAPRLKHYPYAEVAFYQPGFEDIPGLWLYNVVGGPCDRSTVSAETLIEMGIEVPR